MMLGRGTLRRATNCSADVSNPFAYGMSSTATGRGVGKSTTMAVLRHQ